MNEMKFDSAAGGVGASERLPKEDDYGWIKRPVKVPDEK
jgi:hypothetical protein